MERPATEPSSTGHHFRWDTQDVATTQIDEILITLPRGVVHLVEKLTDLQLMNEAGEGRSVKTARDRRSHQWSCDGLSDPLKKRRK